LIDYLNSGGLTDAIIKPGSLNLCPRPQP